MHENDHKYTCTLTSREWIVANFSHWHFTACGWVRFVDFCHRLDNVCTLHSESEILLALTTKNTAFWGATPCRMVEISRRISSTVHTASHPRRLQSWGYVTLSVNCSWVWRFCLLVPATSIYFCTCCLLLKRVIFVNRSVWLSRRHGCSHTSTVPWPPG